MPEYANRPDSEDQISSKQDIVKILSLISGQSIEEKISPSIAIVFYFISSAKLITYS